MKDRTERLYYNYFSAEPFEARILELKPAANGNTGLVLDRTIFYPEGGGQPGDRGTINGVPLLDVIEKDGEILHLVSDHDLAAGAGKLKPGPAELVLDSRRRRDFTLLHTGQHLLSAIILRMIGAPTVSNHFGEENCTIDVDTRIGSGEDVNEELLIKIEENIADAIEENRPVIIHLCPPEDISAFALRKPPPKSEEVIRVVEIEGYDVIACCGTHLASTAEIGMFRVLDAEKYKGMTRISFSAGRRLLRETRALRHNAVIVSRAISAPLNETGKGILDFLEKNAQTERRLKALEEYAVRVKTEALLVKATGKTIIIESYADAGINEVMNIGKAAQKQTQAVLVLASQADRKFAAFCSAASFDLRPLLKDTLEKHGGKGGGGPSFFQGSFGTKEALDGFLGDISN